MKIRFTESRWLDTEDRTKVPKFKEGSTHDLSEASAYRWTRRGYAVYVVEEAPPAPVLNRPMMAEKPKKVGRPKKTKEDTGAAPQNLTPSLVKKPKGDATVREIKTGPALPVKGSGENASPGWNDV